MTQNKWRKKNKKFTENRWEKNLNELKSPGANPAQPHTYILCHKMIYQCSHKRSAMKWSAVILLSKSTQNEEKLKIFIFYGLSTILIKKITNNYSFPAGLLLPVLSWQYKCLFFRFITWKLHFYYRTYLFCTQKQYFLY